MWQECASYPFLLDRDFIKTILLCQEKTINVVCNAQTWHKSKYLNMLQYDLNALLLLFFTYEVFNKMGVNITGNKPWIRNNIKMKGYCCLYTFNPVFG